jgi:hypothetical protein
MTEWRYKLSLLIPMRFESRFTGHQGDWFHISWWQWRPMRGRYFRARTIERIRR